MSDDPLRLTCDAAREDALAVYRHLHARRQVAAGLAGTAALWFVAWGLPSAFRSVGTVVTPAIVTVLLWILVIGGPVYQAWRRPGLVGRIAVDLGPTGVVHQGERWSNRLSWAAVTRVKWRNSGLFLQLSGIQALFVPRRAFQGLAPAEVLRRVEAWRSAGAGAPDERDPGFGFDAWAFEFELAVDDYAALTLALRERTPMRWVRLLLSVPLLALSVLLSVFAWRFGDASAAPILPIALGLVFFYALAATAPLWSRLVVPFTVRFAVWRDPARLPRGVAAVRLGTAGGWIRSPRGASRFSWSDVNRVITNADLVAVVFHGSVAVILPKRVFASPQEMARFSADCKGWMDAAPAEGGYRGPLRGTPAPADPFAPPGQRR